jgi:hypothetical protein
MAANVMAAFTVTVVATHTMAAASTTRISIGSQHKRCHKYGQHDPDDSFHRIHFILSEELCLTSIASTVFVFKNDI